MEDTTATPVKSSLDTSKASVPVTDPRRHFTFDENGILELTFTTGDGVKLDVFNYKLKIKDGANRFIIWTEHSVTNFKTTYQNPEFAIVYCREPCGVRKVRFQGSNEFPVSELVKHERGGAHGPSFPRKLKAPRDHKGKSYLWSFDPESERMVVSTATFGRGSRDLTIHLQLKMHKTVEEDGVQADKQDQVAAFGFKKETPFLQIHEDTFDAELLNRCVICTFLYLSGFIDLPSELEATARAIRDAGRQS